MTVSAMDTAKLPRSHTEGPADPAEIAGEGEGEVASGAQLAAEVPVATAPVAEVAVAGVPVAEVPVAGVPVAEVAVAGRRALREERRHLRRQQRRYAIAGIAVLAAMFLLAIIVLGGIR